ncbi:MAG: 5-(carboxyamino)imidazole ribonucleotide mutase [Acholeplasmataceae bacterium]|nr:5-(carboxyamino)imidazole ribonucleotide mutase [Acholeplasmataceae bacterium]
MNPVVSVVMGSKSDFSVMVKAKEILDRFEVTSEVRIISAHRTPDEMFKYAEGLPARGIKVVIAGAGAAAHIAGMMASKTLIPILGVPLSGTPLSGLDALLSTVQMPSGVPVATFAIGESGAKNAALFALRILALENEKLREKLRLFQLEQKNKVLEADVDL